MGNGIRPRTIPGFLFALPHVFQRHRSAGLDAAYHFTFTGEEPAEATVTIRDETIRVEEGHVGVADLRIIADSPTWLGFLAKEKIHRLGPDPPQDPDRRGPEAPPGLRPLLPELNARRPVAGFARGSG